MNRRMLAATVLVVVGSAAILIGALDPLEGVFIIFPGSGMIALGAYLAQTRHRRFVYWAFLLIAVGFAALVIVSALGGLRSPWWGLFILPYPIGWMMDIVGAASTLTRLFEGRWVRFAGFVVGIWVMAAVVLLVRLIGSHLLPPWGMAAVMALSCLCILGVYFSDSGEC